LKKNSEMEQQLRLLFQQSMTGDAFAYENFLMMVTAIVRRNLAFLGGGKLSFEQLEELQQEVVLSIHQKKHTYSLDRPLLPWIYAIARYRYIDDYRQKKRLPAIVEWLDDLHVEEEGSLESIDYEEILALLTPQQRELFVRIKIEGQTYVQTAQALELSVPAVKVGVHRIMKVLKDKVQR
jgi:RNA polymerase sigma-70 factor, ECF subfamily